MIDPRFANVGAVPVGSGYGAQAIPVHHHRHRHHRQRKSRQAGIGDSPLSRDESIHKVDHGHHFQQNDGAQYGNGFGVPYGASGFGVGAPNSYYSQQQQQQQQQQPYGNGNYGFVQQSSAYSQVQYSGAPPGTMIKHHRRRHRHHGNEGLSQVGDQSQGIPEQLIGQRSSSVLGNEAPQIRSPIPLAENDDRGDQITHSRRRHHRHHHSSERVGFSQSHQSRITEGHTSAGPDGYGHINDDLIFIERGDHSPHRQEPPPGYEYKGKIEVQGIEKDSRSRSQGQSSAIGSAPLPITMAQPCPGATMGGCPPGWQQMILTAAPGGPCPPGAQMYTAQVVGPGGIGQAGLGGMGAMGAPTSSMGYGGVAPMGASGSGGGLANLAATLPIPPQAQLVADYIVEAGANDMGSSAGGGSGAGGGYSSSFQSGCAGEENSSSNRATIIEVWQKRAKSEGREKSHSRSRSRSRSPKSSFDFDQFRNEILGAIERMVQNGGAGAKIQWTGHDGGTQTQINPSAGFDDKKEPERRPTSAGNGEVRVIVQPIQPVFYMPRQGETAATTTTTTSTQGPAPAIQQAASGAPNVVYIPRNVYVPVIKPVFVPRERVIVRPQVIHVARPVLVDRPVPVTQRPIIIDRERPVPVPLRGAGVAAQEASSGYGGRCAEYTVGVNYGQVPMQQEQQYTTSTAQDIGDTYQTQGAECSDEYQHSHSAAQLNVQQNTGGYQETFSNLARTSSASAVDAGPLNCSAPIEVLDATINNTWQRTDKSTLVRRYGRPAYDIVQKTDQVEQQMYQELRQRQGNEGLQRPGSSASYGSSSAMGGMHGVGYAASTGSYSTIPLGDLKHFNPEGIPHQGPAPIPVSINY